MKSYKNVFKEMASLENLFSAWNKFKKGKERKTDVMKFQFHLEYLCEQLKINQNQNIFLKPANQNG